jgi:ADP-ribose pyrophosphatase YjhB (NUDIX family)
MTVSHPHEHEHKFKHCPVCGGPLGPGRALPDVPDAARHPACRVCGFVFYQNPKVVTSVIVPVDGGIVLLKRGITPAYGKWTPPGGFVDRGERVVDAAVRETKEECNLDVRIASLLNVYSYARMPTIIVVYQAEVTGGALEARDEMLEARVFPADAIPWDEMAFPSTVESLRDYFAAARRGQGKR